MLTAAGDFGDLRSERIVDDRCARYLYGCRDIMVAFAHSRG